LAGFGVQKQRALDKATGDWVLSIDADEIVTAELRAEIEQALQQINSTAMKSHAFPVIVAGKCDMAAGA